MIIPVRCFTCGKVLANKWKFFDVERQKLRDKRMHDVSTSDGVDCEGGNDDESHSCSYFYDDPPLGNLLDSLGLERICCRRHMLSHVDLVDII